jgi:hypothetical protein
MSMATKSRRPIRLRKSASSGAGALAVDQVADFIPDFIPPSDLEAASDVANHPENYRRFATSPS